MHAHAGVVSTEFSRHLVITNSRRTVAADPPKGAEFLHAEDSELIR